MKCKYSNFDIPLIHSFGKMPIANNFIHEKDKVNEFFYNLEFSFSEEVSLFQINDYPNVSDMFHSNYAFFSSLSQNMRTHFKEFYQNLKNKNFFDDNSFVVEIGCNDGILLENFKLNEISHLGVEPSENVANLSKEKGLNVVNKFFNPETVSEILNDYKNADLILAANVICHIPNIKELFLSVKDLLSSSGKFVFEEPYLGDMIEKVSYDQIYDEHIYIFSISAIENICNDIGLKLFHCEHQRTHGGSMRYYISKDSKISESENLKIFKQNEIKSRLNKIETFYEFAENCEKSKNILINKLQKYKEENLIVYGYGATSKSTTILNYCNIDKNLVNCICDITPEKQNKLSPGMHIPIFSEKFKENSPPDKYLLFAWNHYDEIMKKEKDFLDKGGEFFTHLYK